MAQTISVSQKELQRVAQLAYEGETLKVMLCVAAPGYTAETSVANWQLEEISGNGYVRGSVVLASGIYSSVSASYEIPQVTISFSATGAGYTYDSIVLYIDGATYPHSVITESPGLTMQAGQTISYNFDLYTDD